MRRAALLAVMGVALIAVASAAAGVVERVNVNGAGRNSTNTFSKTLYIDAAVVSGYVHHSNDGDEGSWNGPNYHASEKPSDHGPTSIGWGVDFDIASHTSPLGLAKKHALTLASWKVLQNGAMSIPHVIGGRKVGTLHAIMLFTQAPDATSYKASVAFSLCKGVVVEVHFASYGPASAEPYQAGKWVLEDGTTEVQPWAHDHIQASLKGVALDGNLPLARITAVAHGKTVTGRATDCLGHPVPHLSVSIGSVRATTNAAGVYTAHASAAGAVSVTATSAGGSAKSTVTVH